MSLGQIEPVLANDQLLNTQRDSQASNGSRNNSIQLMRRESLAIPTFGVEIVLDYTKYKDHNIDVRPHVQLTNQNPVLSKAMKIMRREGEKFEKYQKKLDLKLPSLPSSSVNPPDDKQYFQLFKEKVLREVLQRELHPMNWGKLIRMVVYSASVAKELVEFGYPDLLTHLIETVKSCFTEIEQSVIRMGGWTGFVRFYENQPVHSTMFCLDKTSHQLREPSDLEKLSPMSLMRMDNKTVISMMKESFLDSRMQLMTSAVIASTLILLGRMSKK